MSEKVIVHEIMLAMSKCGSRIFKNVVGVLERKTGERIRTGLCVGSSDLIGWTPITITQNMVGCRIAVFTAVEVKTPTGRVSPEQEAFIKAVRKDGGIAGVARSDKDALKLLEGLK